MLKFLVFLVLVAAVASSGDYGLSGLHFDYNAEYAPNYDNYKPRDYHFDYAVSDPYTGDHKSQWEVRDKGVVRGGYSLLEPDGTTRIVEYVADDDGFRAVVKKLGTSIHPTPHGAAHGLSETHVETHGFPQTHIKAHGIPEPHIIPEAPAVIAEAPAPAPEVVQPYHTYDGQFDNYANIYKAAEPHLQPIPYEKPLPPFHAYEPQSFIVNYENQHPIVRASAVPSALEQPATYHQPILFKPQQLPHESQGQIGNLAQFNNYPPTFSSGQQDFEHLISQPQAVGLGALRHPNAEAPSHQSPFYQGVVAHEPLLAEKPQNIQEFQEDNPDAPYTNYDEGGYGRENHEQYHGEYSEKIRKVVPPPPSKALSHFKDVEPTERRPFVINAGAR